MEDVIEAAARTGAASNSKIGLPTAIVETMHDDYARLNLAAGPYDVFIAGPSATGDIEGVIIHVAQGVGSLTVFLMGTYST
jgi:L-lactate utilization protein LutC